MWAKNWDISSKEVIKIIEKKVKKSAKRDDFVLTLFRRKYILVFTVATQSNGETVV